MSILFLTIFKPESCGGRRLRVGNLQRTRLPLQDHTDDEGMTKRFSLGDASNVDRSPRRLFEALTRISETFRAINCAFGG
jgi:hypothetical protein